MKINIQYGKVTLRPESEAEIIQLSYLADKLNNSTIMHDAEIHGFKSNDNFITIEAKTFDDEGEA